MAVELDLDDKKDKKKTQAPSSMKEWLDPVPDDGKPKPLLIVETSSDAIKNRRALADRVAALEAELRKAREDAVEADAQKRTLADLEAKATAAEQADPFEREERFSRPKPGDKEESLDEDEDDEPAVTAGKPVESYETRSAPVPGDLNPIPLKDFEEHWQPLGQAHLREVLKRLWIKYEFESQHLPRRHISGWYSAAGTPYSQAVPISVKSEFITGGYKFGTYFIRHRQRADEDSPGDQFYVCKIQKQSEVDAEKITPGSKAMAANAVLLRSVEQFSVQDREQTQRLLTERKEVDRLREENASLKTDLADAKRTIERLEEENKALEERADPFIDREVADELGEKIVLGANDWLSDPDKKTREYLDKLLALNRKQYDVLRGLLDALPDQARVFRVLLDEQTFRERYTAAAQAVNETVTILRQQYDPTTGRCLASEQDTLFLEAGEVVTQLDRLLPAHQEIEGSDDELLAAAQEAERRASKAERRVKKLKEEIEALQVKLREHAERISQLDGSYAEMEEIIAAKDRQIARLQKPRAETKATVGAHANGKANGKARPTRAPRKARSRTVRH